MYTLATLLFLLPALSFAGEVPAPPLPTAANPCLSANVDACQVRAPKTAEDSRVQLNASSYRGPRGVPDSMLESPNPEFVPKKKAGPHKEASVNVGVMKF